MFKLEKYEMENSKLKIYLKLDIKNYDYELSTEFVTKKFTSLSQYIKKIINKHNKNFRGKVFVIINSTVITAMVVSCSSSNNLNNDIINNENEIVEIHPKPNDLDDEFGIDEDFIIDDIKEHRKMNLILISGHTSMTSDPGAVYNNRYEFMYTSELTNLVVEAISKKEDLNINVILEPQPLNASGEMNFIKNTKADYAISIHFNAGGGSGSEVIVPFSNTDLTIANEFIKNVSEFANIRNMPIYSRYQNNFIKRIHNQSVGLYTDYYGVIRAGTEVSMPSDILEIEFIDNEKNMIFYDNNKQLYVDSIVDAISVYYEKNFVI